MNFKNIPACCRVKNIKAIIDILKGRTMKTRTKKQPKGPAFTIVELLTVMAVIAMLIGLLVPALNLVRRHAKDTQQRAQFNAINAGLEIFKNDYSDYPESDAN